MIKLKNDIFQYFFVAAKSPPVKKAGRASPGKKAAGQRSSKGKSPEEPTDPSGGPGGGGRGNATRLASTKELGPAFYIGGGNGVAL